jgi:hypothetical protein
MMTDIGMKSRTTPAITPDPLRSLITAYERMPDRTIPAARAGAPSQTPGSTP